MVRKPGHRATTGSLALVLLALAFVGSSVLYTQGLRGFRLDLTRDRLYTLSPGTRELVRGLSEPVELEFYFSRTAVQADPALLNWGIRIQELLEEISGSSDSRLRLRVIDPRPFSEEEDRAAEAGLRAVPLGGAAGTGSAYLGLVGRGPAGGEAVIEFFSPSQDRLLEYQVARLIHQLDQDRKPVVGLISRLPMTFGYDPLTQRMRNPWAIVTQIQQTMELRNIEPSATAIPDDIDVLMLVHPKSLAIPALYAIDQFVMRGGRLIAFVDPSAEQDTAGGNPMDPFGGDGRASDLEPLLSAWGLRFDPGRVVGDAELALTVDSGGEPVRHLGLLGLDERALDPVDPVTAGLGLVNLATAGALGRIDRAGVKVEPLMSSSGEAALIDAALFAAPGDPATLYDGFDPTGEHYMLAARITGTLPSAWPDGPPAEAAAAGPRSHLAQARRDAAVVVVADTDVLADMLWTRASAFLGQRYVEAWADNGDFLLNALDNLSGSAALISIRGRASYIRPFDRVEALRRQADERLRQTEGELERELEATEQRLVELQSQREDDTSLVLTPEQEAELERFRQQRSTIRKQLRELRRDLDRDIETLAMRLKLVNILLLPILFVLLSWLASRRLHRARRASRS